MKFTLRKEARFHDGKPVTADDVVWTFHMLREKGYNPYNPLHKVNKISVSGGGLATGTTKDYRVTLKPGEYVYSCPLNPTPDYKLVVKE